jgi:hypothetical protein
VELWLHPRRAVHRVPLPLPPRPVQRGV